MASRDKVGCSSAPLPLDRVLGALVASAEQLGRRWEAAARVRCGKAAGAVAVGKAERKGEVIEMHTPLFYATCALGGVLSTGLTHLAVTPLDLVKCNMQVRHRQRAVPLLVLLLHVSMTNVLMALLLASMFLHSGGS
jgi:solute carrier family 25 phosphate transporter 3